MKSPTKASIDPISVVIADDHPLVREGLVTIFKSQHDIKLVAEATNGEEALELCNRHLPDVLLFDVRMPKKHRLPENLSPLRSQADQAVRLTEAV